MRTRTASTDNESSPDFARGFEHWREAMRWQRDVNTALRPVGLTHTQFLVLWSLDRAERAERDAVPQRAIADLAGLDASTTSQVLRALEKRSLVDRGPTFGDARAWRVIITGTGKKVLRAAVPLVDATFRASTR